MKHIRAKLFHILHKPSPQNKLARWVNYFLIFFIIGNAICVVLESLPVLQPRYQNFFTDFEVLSTLVFIIEYCARLWVCVEQERFSSPISGRLRYALTLLPMLDLLVIGTFWTSFDLRFLRVLRLVRLLKILRMEEFEESFQQIIHGLQKRKELIVVTFTLMLICIYISSAMVYQLEHIAQPAVFKSIPDTFWWGVVTLTTIGYGDMIPITPLGRIFSALMFVFGIGIFALPMAIVTAVIIEASANSQQIPFCQNCGEPSFSKEKDKIKS